jgi:hypothetical protein
MTIPDELRRSTPRPVSLTPLGKAAVTAFVLLIALFLAEIAWVQTHGDAGHGLPRAAGGVGIYLLILLAVYLRRLPRQWRLLVSGRWAVARTTGELKRVGPTAMRRYRLKCEFSLLSGGRTKATIEARRALPANTEVAIVYDPDEPGKAMVYPTKLLKIEGI